MKTYLYFQKSKGERMIKKQQKAVVLYLKETNAWNDKNLMN